MSMDLTNWRQKKLTALMGEVTESGLVSFAAIEASVEWSLAGSILVAQLRNAINHQEKFWLIGGENIATDMAASSKTSAASDSSFKKRSPMNSFALSGLLEYM